MNKSGKIGFYMWMVGLLLLASTFGFFIALLIDKLYKLPFFVFSVILLFSVAILYFSSRMLDFETFITSLKKIWIYLIFRAKKSQYKTLSNEKIIAKIMKMRFLFNCSEKVTRKELVSLISDGEIILLELGLKKAKKQ